MRNKELILQLREKASSIYTHTLQRGYFRVFGHQAAQRFAIIANARTGSNFLLDGLKSSRAIRMYHEIFAEHNRQIGEDFEKLLSTVFQPESKSTQIVGFKVFYNHLTEEEWKQLQAHNELKVIHLTRRNRLRTVASLEIAFKTGQWTRSHNLVRTRDKRVMLDPLKVIRRLEQIEAGEAATRARFQHRDMLEVAYEDLVRSPEEVFSSVEEYLGVDGIHPEQIRLKRQNPETLRQLILNYDEIETALKNTRFAEYLDHEKLD